MKPSSLSNVRSIYESSADSYSEMMDQEIKLPIYKEVLGRLYNNISRIPGTLLDTACGSGHMLSLYGTEFDSTRSLIGIDISPRMVELAQKQIGEDNLVMVGDMRSLSGIESGTVAAIINFFAIHHLDSEDIRKAMHEWKRVLVRNGYLFLAAWEGSGTIDYGAESNIVALRYTANELTDIAQQAGLALIRCVVEPVEGFLMDATYLECKNL